MNRYSLQKLTEKILKNYLFVADHQIFDHRNESI
jgi:hypothetical protein